MLACGHDRDPFGAPICGHLRVCREPWLGYLKWYTGAGMDTELLCNSCVGDRQDGRPVAIELGAADFPTGVLCCFGQR